jgi:GTPase
MPDLPVVALVGRPNVGKSTLFNRIVGRRQAIVHDTPGTTRDRQYAEAEWQGLVFMLVDTGGMETFSTVSGAPAEPMALDSADFVKEMRQQVNLAIQEADVIVFVVDVLIGTTPADEEIAEMLRRTSKPVIVAASKGDSAARRDDALDFYNLGVEEVFAISGMHGSGVGDLLDAIVEALPERIEEEEADEILKLAILGRPNVGKSSLLNTLVGQERVIVSDVAGTTRDAIDTQIMYEGEPIRLIDTAGIRKRGKIEHGEPEQYSVLRALKAMQRADVALLLIDATQGVTTQDAHIAGYIIDEKKSVIVLVNKWDAVEKDTHSMHEFTEKAREALNFLPYVPIEFISAKTGQRVHKVIPLAQQIHEERFMRLPTAEVNRIVRDAISKQSPPQKAGRRLKIRYAAQVAVDPPKFLFHVNDVEIAHFSYQRYLENQIREAYPFVGTPLEIEFRASSEDRFPERKERRKKK